MSPNMAGQSVLNTALGRSKRDQLAKVKSHAIINTMKSIKAALDPEKFNEPR